MNKYIKLEIEWWKTPSYQRCLEVAISRGFVDMKWSV